MKPFATRVFAALIVAVALCGCASRAASLTAPPPPERWVTDESAFLSDQTRTTLDAQLQAYEQRTGHQVLVYIGTTTGDVPLEDYTVNAFAAWKVGRKGLDDGLVLFVFPKDHTVRVEVGYGLEPVVTDAAASQIIRDVVIPSIKAGQNDAAITNGVAQLLALIDGSPAPEMSGVPAEPSGADNNGAGEGETSLDPAEAIVGGLLLIGFILLFIRSPGIALWLLFSILSGGRGGGYSGGGGFSGGGGRSGGGGASGSW